MTATLPLDVVVATWNSREMVLRCIDRLDSSLSEKIIVVDNGSTDETADAIRRHRSDVEVVRLDESRSLAAAYNRGAESGSAEFILFLNDDVLATNTSIVRLVETLLARIDAVAAAGRLVEPGTGETQIRYQPRRFPTFTTFAAAFAGIDRSTPALDESTIVPVDQPPGACLLIRRAVFEAAGAWDENFEFWYEDVDLARRLGARGAVLYVPTAPFEHVGGWSAQRLIRSELLSRHYRGALLYASKHFGAVDRIATGLLYAFVSTVRISLAPQDEAARSAYFSVLRNGLRLAMGRPILPS